jgi:hypothetical protein
MEDDLWMYLQIQQLVSELTASQKYLMNKGGISDGY